MSSPSNKNSFLAFLAAQVGWVGLDDKKEMAQATALARPIQKEPPSLSTLPRELHLTLFKLLDPVTSCCLGLTCKIFYPVHWANHGPIPLYLPEKSISRTSSIAFSCYGGLWDLLKNWFPGNMRYNWTIGRYVDEEEYDKFVGDYLHRAKVYRVLDIDA
ncbi:hypothetical protein N431DRAFT_328885 [Stipitochalara longipes BDJ]|nr:hypothetical protein N431DRAFT_328885 [Stipitochalara longipes BDJ]